MLRITIPQPSYLRGISHVLPFEVNVDSGNQKTFELSIDVFLKDCCPQQNAYFSRYMEWQGMCRERFFAEKILAGLTVDGVFLTKCAHQEYLDETYAFQRLKILLNTFQVKPCSSFLLFRFMVEDKMVSAGYQQIVFTGLNRHIQRAPEEIYQRVKEYEILPNRTTLAH